MVLDAKGVLGPSYQSIIMGKLRPPFKAIVRAVLGPS
jgi:hypothetical protein